MKKVQVLQYLYGIIAVGLLGGWHLLSVRAGADQSGDAWLIRNYFILVLVCVSGLVVTGYFLYHQNIKLSLDRAFIVTVLWLGSLYMMVLPPLSAPDEISHYISAYKLSDQIMGKPVYGPDGQILIRTEDWFIEDVSGGYQYDNVDGILIKKEADGSSGVLLGQTLTEETYRQIYQQGLGKRGNDNTNEAGERAVSAASGYVTVNTTPLAYLPQALGITLARLLNLNSIGLIYMGRFFNLIFFAVLAFFAMKCMPFGKEVLFGVALLPMNLHLIASYSYDVMILAVLFYFTAYCLNLAYKKEQVKSRDVLILALCMAAAGPCKMVYAPMMGLCLLIPVRKFGGWKKWILSAFAVLGAWIIAMILVNSQTITSYAVESESYVAWAKEAGYSFSYLIHNPVSLIKMFYNTVVWQAEYYHLTMIGAYLGNLDQILDVPYIAVVFFTLCLLGLSFRKPGENMRIGNFGRIWIFCLCILCAGVTMLSMLIAWTPVSSQVILGVQGRYFLPFLPSLLIACKNDFVVLTKNADRTILYLMCCTNAYILMRLFSIVCIRISA